MPCKRKKNPIAGTVVHSNKPLSPSKAWGLSHSAWNHEIRAAHGNGRGPRTPPVRTKVAVWISADGEWITGKIIGERPNPRDPHNQILSIIKKDRDGRNWTGAMTGVCDGRDSFQPSGGPSARSAGGRADQESEAARRGQGPRAERKRCPTTSTSARRASGTCWQKTRASWNDQTQQARGTRTIPTCASHRRATG